MASTATIARRRWHSAALRRTGQSERQKIEALTWKICVVRAAHDNAVVQVPIFVSYEHTTQGDHRADAAIFCFATIDVI
eukprot:3902986-Alexandrium_andersonii.AAC.1